MQTIHHRHGREALDFLNSYGAFWLRKYFTALAMEEKEDVLAEARRKILPNRMFFACFSERRMGEVTTYYQKTLRSEALRLIGRRHPSKPYAEQPETALFRDPYWVAAVAEVSGRCGELGRRFCAMRSERSLRCLHLKYRRGLTLEEISAQVGRPVSTVHAEMQDSVAALRDFIFRNGIGHVALARVFIEALFMRFDSAAWNSPWASVV